jgi:hypothetical protein
MAVERWIYRPGEGAENLAIEIETGKSDVVANVQRDLLAGVQRVIVGGHGRWRLFQSRAYNWPTRTCSSPAAWYVSAGG